LGRTVVDAQDQPLGLEQGADGALHGQGQVLEPAADRADGGVAGAEVVADAGGPQPGGNGAAAAGEEDTDQQQRQAGPGAVPPPPGQRGEKGGQQRRQVREMNCWVPDTGLPGRKTSDAKSPTFSFQPSAPVS